MARRANATIAERITALEAVWEGFPEKVKLIIREVAEELTPQTAHDSLEERVRKLEQQQSFAAGAVKVENKHGDRVHSYVQTMIPLAWPLAIGWIAYLIATHGLPH